MTWSAKKVRRRLQVPRQEHLVAWARADDVGMRVPFPVTGTLRRWAPYVALTEEALWVCRAGVTARFGLEQVVMTSLVDQPDGALRVDFLTGEPLVVLLSDGGTFVHALAREIRALDRLLQRRAPASPDAVGLPWAFLPPGQVRHPSGLPVPPEAGSVVRSGPGYESDEARALLHEAQLIVRRELRLLLTGSGSASAGQLPG